MMDRKRICDQRCIFREELSSEASLDSLILGFGRSHLENFNDLIYPL